MQGQLASPYRGFIDFLQNVFGIEQRALAQKLGVSEALVSLAYHGKRALAPANHRKLEALWDDLVSDWRETSSDANAFVNRVDVYMGVWQHSAAETMQYLEATARQACADIQAVSQHPGFLLTPTAQRQLKRACKTLQDMTKHAERLEAMQTLRERIITQVLVQPIEELLYAHQIV